MHFLIFVLQVPTIFDYILQNLKIVHPITKLFHHPELFPIQLQLL